MCPFLLLCKDMSQITRPLSMPVRVILKSCFNQLRARNTKHRRLRVRGPGLQEQVLKHLQSCNGSVMLCMLILAVRTELKVQGRLAPRVKFRSPIRIFWGPKVQNPTKPRTPKPQNPKTLKP